MIYKKRKLSLSSKIDRICENDEEEEFAVWFIKLLVSGITGAKMDDIEI